MVQEKQFNKIINPMAVRWPNFNFLNPEETVMGHIILNDSKKGLRDSAVEHGCVRANACRDIFWDPSQVSAAIVTCGGP